MNEIGEYVMTVDDCNRKIQMLERRINGALLMITHHGLRKNIEHKQWLIDQIARSLMGGNGYEAWKKNYRNWDEGKEPPL